MALLSNSSAVLITLESTLFNQRLLNTFWYRVSASPTTPTEQSVAFAALDALWTSGANMQSKWLACVPPELTLQYRKYQVITPTRYVAYRYLSTLGGQSDATGYSANYSASITRETDKAGRNQVGGIRIPVGCGDEGVNNGGIHGSLLGAMEALATQMLVSLTAGGYTFKPIIGPGLDGAGNWRDVIRTVVQTTARVMRRRTVGLGE